MKYCVDGLRDIMLLGKSLADVAFEMLVLVGFAVVTSILAAFTLRRGTGG